MMKKRECETCLFWSQRGVLEAEPAFLICTRAAGDHLEQGTGSETLLERPLEPPSLGISAFCIPFCRSPRDRESRKKEKGERLHQTGGRVLRLMRTACAGIQGDEHTGDEGRHWDSYHGFNHPRNRKCVINENQASDFSFCLFFSHVKKEIRSHHRHIIIIYNCVIAISCQCPA